MTLKLRCVEVCRHGLLLAAFTVLSLATTARAVNLVEEFYLPLPEPQVLQACKAITPTVKDTNFAAITSILVTGDGTQIYYDQWEDGYEGNLASPTNATTLIWGDGINTNGICPGFTNDPPGLSSGTVIILSNSVASSPRVASQYYYDGRDRIGANKALVITRAGWPTPTGPVFGGSAVVQPTIDWGTNYVSPIGQDMSDTLFRYTGFFVMASQNNTMVIIDPDGAGPLLAVTNTLNQGESWFYPGGVRLGGTINASKPVSAHMVCGDTTDTFAIDWFTLYPQSDWSSAYYTPVPTVKSGSTVYQTYVYFFNNTATPITIFYTNLVATNNFTLPANGGYKFQMPQSSGAVFVSGAGEKFTTLCAVANGSGGSANDTDYNWGFTPLPKGSLTTEAFTGWAPGTSDYSGNGSPVWVTPTANTRIYVDYYGDHAGPLTDPNGNKYDTNFDLVVFQSKTIYVPGTNSQTGLRVYTIDGTLLSTVWGEDPSVAGAGNPFLDLGNPVLPFPVPRLTKSAVIVTDTPPAGLSVGDTLLYTVQVDNKGLLPLGNTVVVDAPPASLSYISNSTSFNGAPIPDSVSGTAFPLDTPGYTIPIILSGGTTIIQYKATIVAAGSIQNSAGIPGYNVTVTNTVPAVPPSPSFFVSKTILSPASGVAGVGQVMQFNLQIINNGNVPLPNVSVTDNYPSDKFSFVSASVTPNVAGNGQIVWTNLGTLATGTATNLIVSLLVTNAATRATNFAIAVSPGNTTNSGSVVFTNLAAPVAAVTVNKTIVTPASGAAGIGQTIQYALQVYNSGSAILTNLSLVDNFPRTNVSFVSASIAPNLITTSNLIWTNLGSFAVGQITNITVNFTVTNYSANITNSAIAAAVGGATNSSGVLLSLSRSGLTVTKTVLSPTNQLVNLGSNVVFRIVIRNSGAVAITNVPLEDTYSAGYFQYVSATIPPNSIAPGDLYWTNIAGVGGLATNAVITNDVTLLVTGGATPAYNTAAANFSVDVNGASVAPASSVAAVNTAAGSISGNVYGDPDQSGTLTVGDSPLENVDLLLYTDPNGDGNPADGALLQTVTSDVNGYYELLNLSTGAFIVVQSILPGYTGTAPANNRRAILISSLTSATNQNFFQYSVPTTNYSTVTGTVWNDVNAVGVYQGGDTGLTNVQVDLVQDFNTNGVVDAGETAVQTVFTTTNGTYFFSGVAPGRYVIRETDLPGYISTGDAQGTNDNQIAMALANGSTTNGNDFFDFYFGLGNTNNPPVAVPDFVSTLQNVLLTIAPLVNDNSPGGFVMGVTNIATTNGTASIIGGTNVLFTPTLNFVGTATIGYTMTNINGHSTALITITVSPAANLALGKAAATTVFAASNLVYTISVTNLGPSSASSVTVTDAVPAGAAFVSASSGGVNNSGVVTWSVGTLTSNQVTNVTMTVAAPASGSLTNVASGGSPTGDSNPTNNVTPPVVTTVTPLADVVIAKSGAVSVFALSNLTYTISVTNLGPSSAGGVLVTDTLPAGVTFVSATGGGVNNNGVVTWNFGALTNSQSSNVTVMVTTPASGTLTNFASVGGPTLDPTPTNNVTPPVITTVTPVADVRLGKTGAATVFAVSNLTYTINVTNFGPSSASSVTVTDTLPAGVTFVSATGGGANNSGLVTWSVGTLTSNQVTNVSVTVTAPPSGTLTNVASGGSPTGDPVPTNNVTPPVTTTVTPLAALAIGKVGPATVLANSNFSYTISVTNFGPSSASSVTVTDTLPATVTFVGASGNGNNASGVVTWSVGTLVSNQVTNVTVTVTSPAGGSLTNVASVGSPTGDPVPTNNVTPPVITTVTPVADVRINKTGPAGNILGANYNYTLTVSNGGPSTATSFSVTDSLPVGLVFVSSVPSTTTNASNQAIWNLGSLTAGATSNLTLTVFATQRGSVTNIASVGGPTLDPVPTNNLTPPVVTGVTNRVPVAANDNASTPKNVAVTVPVLVNDSDADGDALTIIAVAPTNGIASISGTNVIFTPTNNFLGTAIIGYTITDGFGGTNSALIFVTVTNRLPVAVNDSTNAAENVAVTIRVLVNDSDPDGDALTIVFVSPTNGTASISGTNVIFTPATNFVGTATVGYSVTDGFGGTNSALITINVTNRPPIANPDNYAVTENTTNSLPVLINDVVVTPGGTLSIISVNPTNGTASISGANIVFVPATNFLGTATIGYTITDGVGGTNTSLVTVTVTNIPPLANPDAYSMAENTTNTLTPLANDTLRTFGGTLTIISVSPTNGTASIVGGTNVTFTPTLNFLGTATIGYTITDGIGGTNTSLITVTVTNVPPVANPDAYSMAENTTNTFNPLVNDIVRTPGGVLSIVGVSPTNGIASIVGGTNVTFTPTLNFLGTAMIGYTITDGIGGTNTSLITISVTNRPPIANPDSYSVTENTTNTLPVLVNDVVITPGGTLSIVSVSPTNGTASISGTNIIFTPMLNFLGTATIGYTITDGIGGTNTSLITVIVTNIPPLANPDVYGVTENTTNTLTPLVNDTVRTPGGTLSIVSVNPTNGTASIIGGTNISFTPSTNFLGAATIGYTITDGIGGTNTSLITVTVTNIPPLANPDAYSMAENTTNSFPSLSNDVVRTPGGVLSVISVSPTNGVASIVGGTNVTFTPTLNFLGTATIGYTITDGIGGTNTSLITISVTNRPPVANPDSYSVTENTTNRLPVLVNDLVVTPGGILTIIAVNPTNGTANINGTNIVFVPATNFLGTATIGYTITDGIGGTNSTVVTVVVTNIPPVANPDGYTVFQNSTNTFGPLTNDVLRTPGGTLSIVSVNPTNGTATISGTNIIFTPTPGFTGPTTIGYTITDGIGGTNSTVITVSVLAQADLGVTKSGPPSVYAATNFDYTITVTNSGPGTASGLSVTDNLPASVTFVSALPAATLVGGQLVWTNLGSLAAHTATALTVTVTAPVTGVTLTNVANIDSPTSDPNPTNDITPPVVTVVTPVADVVVVKSASVSVFALSNLTYTISVTNLGPSTAGGVLVTDTLPVGVTFVSASGGGVNNSGVVTWSFGALTNSQSSNVTVTVTAPASGTLTNFASVGGPTLDPTPTNNVTPPVITTVTPVADVRLGKSGAATVFAVSNLTYTVSVTNFGPSSASSVTVTDTLPVGVAFVSATGGGANNSGVVTWSVGTLTSNQVTNVSVTVTAPPSGTLTNVASGGSPTGDPVPTNNVTPPVTTTVTPLAALAIGKVGPATVLANSNFSYTISVTNFGPSSASSVTVTDALPATVTFLSASGNGANNSGVVTWSVGNLSSNQVTNVTVTVTSPAGGSLTNVASVGSPTGDPVPTNNVTPPVITTVTPVADVSLVKTAPAMVLPGANFVYAITVTNGGPSSAANLSVTDSLPVNVVLVSATVGSITNNGQLIWTNLGTLAANSVTNLSVTVAAPIRDSITNTASVGSPTLDPVPTNNVTPLVITLVSNLPPVAVNDTTSTPVNVPVTIYPLVNDFDTNGDTLTIVSLNPTNGTASFTATNVLFTPTLSFLGTATVGYTITDGHSGTNSAIIFISVTNRPPVANDDVTSGTNGQAQVINPLGNDTDPDGDALIIIGATSTTGIVAINGGSTNLTFTPTNNGVCIINYTISDGHGGTDTAVITVNAGSVADLIVAKIAPASVLAVSNFSYTISVTNLGPSTAVGVIVTDTLPASVTFVGASGNGTHNSGTVTWNLGAMTALQATNLTLTVTAPATGVNLTNVASVGSPTGDPVPTNNLTPPVITGVTPVADVSIVKTGPAGALFGTNYNYTLTVSNGGPSTATSLSVTDSLPAGLLFVTSTPLTTTNASNQVIWNLGNLATGVTSNLTLTVISIQRGSLTNTARVGGPTLDPTPTNNLTPPVVTIVTNNPPLANPDLQAMTENTTGIFGPLTNDVVRTPGGVLTIIGVSTTNGTASVLNSTNISFTPATNFIGLTTLIYTITDNVGGTNSSTLTILVTNIPPLANPDAYSMAENTTNTVTPLVNDVLRTAGGTLSIVSVSPTNGTATISGTNVVFTPTLNFLGTATIGYTSTDGIGGTNTSLISISVTNRPPVANPDSYAITENTTNALPVLINDVVVTTGGTLSIVSVSPTNGTASISGTNIIFTPTLNFLGTATIGYTIIDGIGGTNGTLVTILVTNIPPIANPDVYSMAENTTNTLAPLVNDSVRTAGGSLSIVSVSPTNGTASISGTNVIFTPTLNFLGTATVGYTITDGIGGTNTSLITVTVTNVPPVANPDIYSMTENTTNTLSPLLNDLLRTPGGILSIISTAPTNGTATISGTNIVFTPTLNFLGTATIGYTISDGIGGTSTSLITVLVTNIPPLANPDAYSMMEDGTNTLTPLVNDVLRTPGGILSIVSVSPTNGTASIVGGTNVIFIPTHSFVGVTTIGYTIIDNIGGTNTSLITVTVTNQSPIAFPQSLFTTENTALPLTLDGGDPVGRPLTFIIVSSPAHGALTGLNTNTGAVTYTPTNNFLGTDTFVFRVNNGVNNSSNATITIDVTPIADLLVQQSGPISGIAGSNLVYTVAVTNLGPAGATNVVITNAIATGFTFVSASASGANSGGVVTWTISVLPANGKTNLTVTVFAVEGGTFTNIASGFDTTPDLNATNNNGSLTNAQVVTTVSALADVAVFKAGNTSVLAGGTVSYTITATNAGPSTAASVVVQDRLPVGATSPTASGDYVVSNNVIVWTATDLIGGTATNFTVTLTAPFTGTLTNSALSTSGTPDSNTNNNNGSSSNSIVRTVVTPVADLVAGKSGAAAGVLGVNFSYTISVTNLGPSTAANFSVTDSLPAGIVFVSAVPATTTNASSQVIWTNLGTLAANATTNLTLTVKAVTRGVVTNIATVGGPTLDPTPTNNVSPPVVTSITNRPPVAGDDFSNTPKNVAVTVPVLVNDTDPEGDTLTVTFVSPTHGIASISGTNVIFTPTNNFIGITFVTYTISDGLGGTDSGLITINVTNRPPVAVNDASSTPKNVAVTIPVLANDSDLDGDTLAIVGVTPTNGIASISGTNVVFTPTNNFLGTAIIGYTITDGFGGTNSALIFVTVTNRAPVAVNDVGSTSKNAAVTIPALANDSDPDGDVLTIISVSPTNGIASISGANVIFTPTNNFLGTAIIGYRIIDGFGGTNSALLFVTVTNRAPVAQNDSATTPKNTAVTIPALANDGDPDGDVLTIISVSPTNGIASISGTNVIFTPTNNFLGTTFIGYTIRDNFGGTNSALITVLVTNRAPVAVNDSTSTPKNVAVTVPALANDSDPDGDVLTIISVSPTNGIASINGTNVVFTSTNNFIGTATVGYTIIDGFGGTNSALITINVTNRPPVANGQSVTTTFNTAKAITLTGSDADGDTLTFIIIGAPANGVLSLLDTNTGAVTYTPMNNFTGVDTFTFRVNDGTANSAVATVTITVGTPVIADLAVFKTGPANSVAGSNLIYTITVTNIGPSIATNVLVGDQLPAGFTFASATPVGATVISNVVNWAGFKLGAHATTNLTVTALSAEGGTYTNFAFATSDAFDPNTTNNNGTSTNSQVRTVISPLADVQVYKDGGTNVAAGGVVNYIITATNAGPSTATNVVVQDNLPPGSTFQGASGSFTVTNNVVTWAAIVLTNGASTNFTISLTAPPSGLFTNIALATSTTPDPNSTNNNGSFNKSRVATKVVPVADLVVLVFGPPNAIQGSNFVYSLILSNAGPSVASNAVASDALPTNLVFVSASSGGAFSNGTVTWPNVKSLGVGGTTNYFITVYSPLIGVFTNLGYATSTTLDPNPTNNSGVLPSAQVQTTVTFAQFSFIAGTPIFNPQTGLYEETVIVTNTGTGTVAGFQLYVTVLTPNVFLWNATGTNSGGAYLQYNFPVDPSNHVSMILEFYNPLRVAFTNTLRVVPVIPAPAGNVGTNGSVNISKVFTDTRTNGTRFVIEFVSVPGKTYTIIYSSDMVTWKVATPSVTANANVTQWYDDGPPKTESLPVSVGTRFYRVIQN